jgi:hypothetical protein
MQTAAESRSSRQEIATGYQEYLKFLYVYFLKNSKFSLLPAPAARLLKTVERSYLKPYFRIEI